MANNSLPRSSFPFSLKKGEINDYAKVTQANKKNALVIGRIVYCISQDSCIIPAFTMLSRSYIYPRFPKGWIGYHDNLWGNNRFYSPEQQPLQEYRDSIGIIFDYYVLKEILYINPKDPLIKFKLL